MKAIKMDGEIDTVVDTPEKPTIGVSLICVEYQGKNHNKPTHEIWWLRIPRDKDGVKSLQMGDAIEVTGTPRASLMTKDGRSFVFKSVDVETLQVYKKAEKATK